MTIEGPLAKVAIMKSLSISSKSLVLQEKRSEEDIQVQCQAPVVQVEQITTHPRLQTRGSSKPVNLRPARDARLRGAAFAVLRNLLLEGCRVEGAFRARADQAHVAAKDVPELRHLIDVQAPHQPP